MVTIFDVSLLCADSTRLIHFLRVAGILVPALSCDSCVVEMRQIRDNSRSDNFFFRCPECHKKRSIRHGSRLSDSRLSLQQFLYAAYLWTIDVARLQALQMLGVSGKLVTKTFKSFRAACRARLDAMDMRIGGVGSVVQVDESVVYRAKHHRGHALHRPPKWVLGLYDVQRKIGIVSMVPNRKAGTLIPLIEGLVLPGSEIHTDMWRGYLPLSQPPYQNTYVHRQVNHSQGFLERATGVHTNNVEAYWSSIKRKFKVMNGCPRNLTESYLYEHMYRERFFRGDVDKLLFFLIDFARYV
jgi:transposase-like protein